MSASLKLFVQAPCPRCVKPPADPVDPEQVAQRARAREAFTNVCIDCGHYLALREATLSDAVLWIRERDIDVQISVPAGTLHPPFPMIIESPS